MIAKHTTMEITVVTIPPVKSTKGMIFKMRIVLSF